MDQVILKAGCAKPLWKGHPWVHRDSIARIDEGDASSAPDWVTVRDEAGRIVGTGFHSPRSALAVRIVLPREVVETPEALLASRINEAVALRLRLFPDPALTNAYRLIHAEGDGLPGLVVDRWGDVLVAQFSTASMHRRRAALSQELLLASGARTLIARPGGHEEIEGIASEEQEYRLGEATPEQLWVREQGLEFLVEPEHGQKTGHYADQRENRVRVAEVAAGLEVLDLYAGTGGFSLSALRHGARRVEAVESSARACRALELNALRAGITEPLQIHSQDVRTQLIELRSAKRSFGVVVADPPNFFPRKGGAGHALKAYREINVLALGRVAPGGFFASFCCTASLGAPELLDLLRAAGGECRTDFRVLRELAAGPDHPVLPGHPQGRYLSGFLLQVLP